MAHYNHTNSVFVFAFRVGGCNGKK